jgi:hypothetical protein
MASIKLNIYKEGNKNEVEKTYTAESYELMMGTVEDIVGIIDLEKIDDDKEIAKMILKGYGQIKPLLIDVFPGLTEDEIRRVKVPELVPVIIGIGKAALESMTVFKKAKN